MVILVSDEDPAALNILQSIVDLREWLEFSGPETVPRDRGIRVGPGGWGQLNGMFSGRPGGLLHPFRPCVIMKLRGAKLYWEDIDATLRDIFAGMELIIFPSRHKSESGLRTLTVHPTGNYLGADFGGTPGRLSVCAPAAQTFALRHLKRRAEEAGLDHGVSFESTHHGPLISTPHFFIEIGSDDDAWVEEDSGRVLARAILDVVEDEGLMGGGGSGARGEGPAGAGGDAGPPGAVTGGGAGRAPPDAVIGVGGGHYCPRFTEVALHKRCFMGHMVPNYALECGEASLLQAVERTPGARYVYFHKKSMKGAKYRELRDWFTSPAGGGLEEIRGRTMEDLDPGTE